MKVVSNSIRIMSIIDDEINKMSIRYFNCSRQVVVTKNYNPQTQTSLLPPTSLPYKILITSVVQMEGQVSLLKKSQIPFTFSLPYYIHHKHFLSVLAMGPLGEF